MANRGRGDRIDIKRDGLHDPLGGFGNAAHTDDAGDRKLYGNLHDLATILMEIPNKNKVSSILYR